MRMASAFATASAIGSVTSPSKESAITIPIGPMIMSAFRQATITGFSPVAAFFAPAFNIVAVAIEFVPIAVIIILENLLEDKNITFYNSDEAEGIDSF